MNDAYAERIAAEKRQFDECVDVHALPDIFHYWSHTYVRPMLEEVGVSNPDQLFSVFLRQSAQQAELPQPVKFLSVGSGNCDTEVRVAKLLLDGGLTDFSLECLDLNSTMLERGRQMAADAGLSDYLEFTECDFNRWSPSHAYHGVMANQSLHHVLDLEKLFASIKLAMAPRSAFVVSDMIGRNGHQRWPEALAGVHRFWEELPSDFRYNILLQRHESLYENWDCSTEGFEGIRAQDILPLLLQEFHFSVFIGFGNLIDPFVDRCFGHHFDAKGKWDRRFIDRVHAADEDGFRNGTLTPTHMMAVLQLDEPAVHHYARGLSPEASLRRPDTGSNVHAPVA